LPAPKRGKLWWGFGGGRRRLFGDGKIRAGEHPQKMKNPLAHAPLKTHQTVTVNPHVAQPTSLAALAHSLWSHRQLIVQMTRREVVGRYKGSAMGLTWSFFNPVFMLVVYTFVFSEIFKSRWGGVGADDSKTQFAVLLFVGMIVLSLFSEVLNRAPTLIVANANYVKKVVFPIEILPVIAMGAALFHSLISLGVLLVAFVLFNGYLQWTVIFLPLVFLPLVVLTTGLAWMLASLGVFLRDVGQTIGIITTVLMFLSPVFYPVTAVPERFRPFIMANPLTFIIEQAREVLIWGHLPNWLGLSAYTVAAVAVTWLGYFWFQKTRKGFADVL
jgi:lipopolysaccharide transport system permease protein